MVSGQYGTLMANGAVVCCDHWTFSGKTSVHKRGHNLSGGFKEGVRGTRDGSGTMKGPVGPSGHAPFADGDVIESMMFYTTATAGKSIPIAIVSEVKEELDLDNGDIVGWDANFEVSGSYADF
jgi:hypothetical protein